MQHLSNRVSFYRRNLGQRYRTEHLKQDMDYINGEDSEETHKVWWLLAAARSSLFPSEHIVVWSRFGLKPWLKPVHLTILPVILVRHGEAWWGHWNALFHICPITVNILLNLLRRSREPNNCETFIFNWHPLATFPDHIHVALGEEPVDRLLWRCGCWSGNEIVVDQRCWDLNP